LAEVRLQHHLACAALLSKISRYGSIAQPVQLLL
jgi:hypothetical protein